MRCRYAQLDPMLTARTPRSILIILSLLLLFSPTTAAGSNYPIGLTWSEAPRPILDSATEYLVQGQMLPDGSCEYIYPEITIELGALTPELHTLAIDPSTCTKVVLEGYSASTIPMQEAAAGTATVSTTRTSRYQQQMWYEDVIGITVTWSQTKIAWQWNGSCALGGSVYRYYDMYEYSGWEYWTGNKAQASSCTYYVGNSWVTFRNAWFCSQEGQWIVWAYVDRNKIFGRHNGSVTLDRAMRHSASCGALFDHWTGGYY